MTTQYTGVSGGCQLILLTVSVALCRPPLIQPADLILGQTDAVRQATARRRASRHGAKRRDGLYSRLVVLTALGILLEVTRSTLAEVLKAVRVVSRTRAVVVTPCV